MKDYLRDTRTCPECGFGKVKIVRHDIIQMISFVSGAWVSKPTQEIKVYSCDYCHYSKTESVENSR